MKEEIEARLERLESIDIDEKILPLVKSVNLYCESFMSCQGHLDAGSWRYPYVSIEKSEDISELREKVQKFNNKAEISWNFSVSSSMIENFVGLYYLEPSVASDKLARKVRYEQRELLLGGEPRVAKQPRYPQGRDLEDFQESSRRLGEYLQEENELGNLLE